MINIRFGIILPLFINNTTLKAHMNIRDLRYNPNKMFNVVLDMMKLKNDAALARILCVPPPLISKVRHRRMPVSAGLLIGIHELTGLSIRELKSLSGDRRRKHRISFADGRPKTFSEFQFSESQASIDELRG